MVKRTGKIFNSKYKCCEWFNTKNKYGHYKPVKWKEHVKSHALRFTGRGKKTRIYEWVTCKQETLWMEKKEMEMNTHDYSKFIE